MRTLLLFRALFSALFVGFTHAQFFGFDYTVRRGTNSTGYCPGYDGVFHDMASMKLYGNAVRLYNLYDCNGGYLVAKAAKELGMDIFLGMQNAPDDIFGWEKHLFTEIVEEFGSSNILGISVGCESIFRKDMTPQEVADAIWNVKSLVKSMGLTFPYGIGYADNDVLADDSAQVVRNASDVLLFNIFAYYDGNFPSSLKDNRANLGIINRLKKYQEEFPDKIIVLGESGWPSGHAVRVNPIIPGLKLQNWTAQQLVCGCRENNISFFWFQSHDLPYRYYNYPTTAERTWGLWTENRELKQPIQFSCDGYTYVPSYPPTSSSSSSIPMSSSFVSPEAADSSLPLYSSSSERNPLFLLILSITALVLMF
eukprot:TRINITY_DN2582_c0_g1_i1.p1 TRINITY_DN2582_c0_g1~~TRINITY_DN2582_c0_g1_i1.p1  ORF type:complete len:398 (+),score=69.97 TRINITY_DN2582_c0_g1_i1:95-1195(+)